MVGDAALTNFTWPSAMNLNCSAVFEMKDFHVAVS
jgi:hypothetical protein